MPAATALFRDMTGIRFEHPQWIAENCTACGDCYTVCPDTAIPGLVNEVGQILDTVLKRIGKQGKSVKRLPRAVRQMEQHLRKILSEAKETDNVSGMIEEAIGNTLQNSQLDDSAREELKQEFELFREELNGFQFAFPGPILQCRKSSRPVPGAC